MLLIARKKALPADDLQNAGRLDEGASRRRQIRQPECLGAARRPVAAKAHRHAGAVHSLSRRRPCHDRSDLGAGRSLVGARRWWRCRKCAPATVKALAELSPQRSASMPDIPSADESGVAGLYIAGWFGFYAPKGTPPDVIAKLNAATVTALADPTVRARFAQLGLDVAPREQQTPHGLAAFQKAEIEKVVADHQSGRDPGRIGKTRMRKFILLCVAMLSAGRRRPAPRAGWAQVAGSRCHGCRRCRSRSTRSCRTCSTSGAPRAAPSSI